MKAFKNTWVKAFMMVILLIGTLVPSVFGANEKSLPTVSIGYFPDIWSGSTILVAEKQGFFEKAGIKVDAQRFTAGAPALAAISSGKLDISFVGLGPMASIMGGAAKIVGIDNITFLDQVIVQPDSGINSIKDLKGKDVMTPPNSGSQILLYLALKKEGMTPNDIKVISSNPDTTVSAMISKQVPAAAIWSPFNTEIAAKAKTKVLISGKDMYPDYVWPGLWMANKDFVSQKADLLQRALWAIEQATTWRAQNLDKASEMAKNEYNLSSDTVETSKANTKWMTTDDVGKIMQDGTLEKWMDGVNAQLGLIGALKEPIPMKQWFDTDNYLQIQKNGLPQGTASGTSPISTGTIAIIALLVIILGGSGILLWRRMRM